MCVYACVCVWVWGFVAPERIMQPSNIICDLKFSEKLICAFALKYRHFKKIKQKLIHHLHNFVCNFRLN